MKKISVWFILLAGIFWGSMGIFVRTLGEYGFSTMQIAAIRLSVAAAVFWAALIILRPKSAKIKLKDLPLLIALGLLSIAGMCVSYFTTISLSTMSAAAILLYLSPVAVMLMSAIFLKEKITPKKIAALIMAVLGCALVAGLGSGGSVGIPAIISGLISAVTYGSYSIFGTKALKKHDPLTVTAYAFTFAAIPVLILCNPSELVATAVSEFDLPLILWMIGEGVVTAVVPFGLYTVGLKYTAASKAAVVACSEPVAATVFGLIVYSEMPSLTAYIGIALVLAAIVLLNVRTKV